MPVSDEEKLSEHYQKGVSCPYCYDKHSREQIKGFAERERQMELARERGENHIGQPMQTIIETRKRQKLRFKEQQRKRSFSSVPESAG